jgi:hypothetical protein
LAEASTDNKDYKIAIEVAISNKKCAAYALTVYFNSLWLANSEVWTDDMNEDLREYLSKLDKYPT